MAHRQNRRLTAQLSMARIMPLMRSCAAGTILPVRLSRSCLKGFGRMGAREISVVIPLRGEFRVEGLNVAIELPEELPPSSDNSFHFGIIDRR
jgi:hypothetical protein